MKDLFSKFKINWKAGLTVSLVSIPLSVSLAVASQSTPTAGIITAIWAGLIASLFGGSNYNIIGPTGALSGVLAAYALTNGANALPMLAIVSGVFIFIAFALKLERFLVFVPASTIHGFILGVAVIIAANQINFALGLSGLEKHEHFIENVIESFKHISETSLVAVAVFAIGLAALFAFVKWTPKLPGAIILAPIGILLGFLSQTGKIGLELQTLDSKFPDIAARLFEAPDLYFSTSILVPAFTVAVVAILETMISAKVADGMTGTKHHKRKEMFGLGLANIASGLMGGIPATAALARTSLNVKTGATDKISATISSICILLISLLLLSSFRFIPLAVIASILVFVAIRMVEKEHMIRMFKVDKKGFVLAVIVAIVTIVEDPIIGIVFGTAVALLIFMEKLSHGQFELIMSGQDKKFVKKITAEHLEEIKGDGDTIVYSVKGQLAYMNGSAHVARFEKKLNAYHNVILRMRECYFIDLDGVDAFDEIVMVIKEQKKKVMVTGVSPLIAAMLEESEEFAKLKKEGLVFGRTSEALASIGY